MDRMRARKPSLKSQPSKAPKATVEEFKPAVDWTEDSSDRLLHMQLPGFKREDIRFRLDNGGKLLVKGFGKVSDNKYLVVDRSFDVPKDTITENISMIFEDGRLTLIMPKKVVEEKEVIPEEKPYTAEGKKEEQAIQDKKAQPSEEPTRDKEKDEPILEEKKEAKTAEDKKDEPTREKPATTEEKQEEPSRKEKSKEKKDDGPTVQEKPESGEEKKDDASNSKEKTEGVEEEGKSEKAEEEEKDDSTQTGVTKSSAMEREKEEEPIQLMMSMMKEICADKTKDIRKRISAWRGTEGSWLASGSFNGILEKLKRHRKVIAVAIVAFSAGFFVYHIHCKVMYHTE